MKFRLSGYITDFATAHLDREFCSRDPTMPWTHKLESIHTALHHAARKIITIVLHHVWLCVVHGCMHVYVSYAKIPLRYKNVVHLRNPLSLHGTWLCVCMYVCLYKCVHVCMCISSVWHHPTYRAVCCLRAFRKVLGWKSSDRSRAPSCSSVPARPFSSHAPRARALATRERR